MGVKHLWSVLDGAKVPATKETYRGKRVAIDASIWIEQFRSGAERRRGARGGGGGTSGYLIDVDDVEGAIIAGFLWRLLALANFQITPVFVFDGATPVLKRAETHRRCFLRQQQQELAVGRKAKRLLAGHLMAAGEFDLAAAVRNQQQPHRGHRGVIAMCAADGPSSEESDSCEGGSSSDVDSVSSGDATGARGSGDEGHPRVTNAIEPKRVTVHGDLRGFTFTQSSPSDAAVRDGSNDGLHAVEANGVVASANGNGESAVRVVSQRSTVGFLERAATLQQREAAAKALSKHNELHSNFSYLGSRRAILTSVENQKAVGEASAAAAIPPPLSFASHPRPPRWVNHVPHDAGGVGAAPSTLAYVAVPCQPRASNIAVPPSAVVFSCDESSTGSCATVASVSALPVACCCVCRATPSQQGSVGDIAASTAVASNMQKEKAIDVDSDDDDDDDEIQLVDKPREPRRRLISATAPFSPAGKSALLYRFTSDDGGCTEQPGGGPGGALVAALTELIGLFGWPCVVAPFEAEAQCAYLSAIGAVDAVVTEDSDTFLFGAREVVRHLFSSKDTTAQRYHRDDVLARCGLDRGQLVVLAIILGSDYARGCDGIGVMRALEIVAGFGQALEGQPDDDGDAFAANRRGAASGGPPRDNITDPVATLHRWQRSCLDPKLVQSELLSPGGGNPTAAKRGRSPDRHHPLSSDPPLVGGGGPTTTTTIDCDRSQTHVPAAAMPPTASDDECGNDTLAQRALQWDEWRRCAGEGALGCDNGVAQAAHLALRCTPVRRVSEAYLSPVVLECREQYGTLLCGRVELTAGVIRWGDIESYAATRCLGTSGGGASGMSSMHEFRLRLQRVRCATVSIAPPPPPSMRSPVAFSSAGQTVGSSAKGHHKDRDRTAVMEDDPLRMWRQQQAKGRRGTALQRRALIVSVLHGARAASD